RRRGGGIERVRAGHIFRAIGLRPIGFRRVGGRAGRLGFGPRLVAVPAFGGLGSRTLSDWNPPLLRAIVAVSRWRDSRIPPVLSGGRGDRVSPAAPVSEPGRAPGPTA